jgi:hypothetical protein
MAVIPWTYLTIDGVRPLNRTARNIKAQWSRIEVGGDIVRLANGTRRSLRRRQFDKYRVTLSGEAVRKPAIDHLRKGDVVVVGWPGHFDLPGDVADADLPRPAVAGSILRFGEVDGMPVALAHGAAGVLVTAFRPVLSIMIDDVDVNEDAAGASVSWTISGEEV